MWNQVGSAHPRRMLLADPIVAPRVVVKPDTRIAWLDGLRGIASLMVLVYHFGPHIVRDPASPFAFLHSIPSLWLQGVDLFFVISGFLISGILVEVRNSPRYFQTFYARRAFRIFPLYYLVLLGYLITIGFGLVNTGERLFENPLPVWSYLLNLQNFTMTAAGSFGPIWMAGSWSLAVEEQFYLTLPAMIRKIDDKGLLQFALFGVGGAVLLRLLAQKLKFMHGIGNYVLLPARVDSLAVGVLVMLLFRHWHDWMVENRGRIVSLTAIFAGLWTVYPFIPNPQSVRLAFLEHTVTAAVFGAVLVCLLLFPDHGIARFLSRPTMRSFGNMAYSTYLFHPILLCLAFRLMAYKDPELIGIRDLAPLAVAGGVTLLLSWLSWTQFESRLIKLGHRFRY